MGHDFISRTPTTALQLPVRILYIVINSKPFSLMASREEVDTTVDTACRINGGQHITRECLGYARKTVARHSLADRLKHHWRPVATFRQTTALLHRMAFQPMYYVRDIA